MKNKLQKFFSAGLLSASAMCIGVALMTTGCSSDNSSVAGGDSEEYIEDVESGGDEGASSSSIASKDKKGKSSSSEKSEKVESSSSHEADSSSVEEEYAIKNMTLTGVAQKGPFVDGFAYVVEVDCETFSASRKFDPEDYYVYHGFDIVDGSFNIENINFDSPCAEIRVNGYYLDEHTGKKSKKEVWMHSFVNLETRSTANVNVFTQLEYERVRYLVDEKKMSATEAMALARKEILALFDIEGEVGEFQDMNIFEPGEANAALLAASVLLTAQTDSEKNAHLTYSIDSLRNSYAKTGEWDDEMKTKIGNWAKSAKENGQLETIRKNIAGWKYADVVPEFEKYVQSFGEKYSSPENEESSKESSHPKEWHELHDIIYHYIQEENTPETLGKKCCQGSLRRDELETNPEEFLMDKETYIAEFGDEYKSNGRTKLRSDARIWDGDEWDDPRYPNVHYEVWLDTVCVGEYYYWDEVTEKTYYSGKISADAEYKIRYTIGVAPNVEEHKAFVDVYIKLNSLDKPYIPPKKEE